jgi:parvulin-like peptidyl-prolyl isomerase
MTGRLLAALLVLSAALAGSAMPPQQQPVAAQPSPSTPVREPVVQLALDSGPKTVGLFSPEAESVPAAKAGDEVITVAQLARALAAKHEAPMGKREKAGAAGMDFRPVLERLANVRLLIAEAREMGIGDLPEVKEAGAAFEKVGGREMLQAHATRDVKPDALEVEQRYRELVREPKVRSALFVALPDAEAFRAAVSKGGDFGALSKKAVEEKKAKADEVGAFVPTSKLLPEVAAALAAVQPGGVTEVVKLKEGYTVALLEEVRFPDDPAARAKAENESLVRQKKEVLKTYYASVVKRFAVVDRKLLKTLDLEAKKPGLEALKKDKRVVARIKGAAPITVGDLTTKVAEQFFHGMDRAAEGKKVNKMIDGTFDALLSERLVPLEAKRVGIVDSPEYQRRLADSLDASTFSLFLQRAIVPQVKVTEQEVRAYYDANSAEFAYPAMLKLEGLGYGSVADAQAALDKLRAGTDLKWLKANSGGQLDAEKAAVTFTGAPVAATALPDDLAAQLTAPRAGDIRLFKEGDQAFVVRVVEVTPTASKPFEEARGAIEEKLFFGKLNVAMEEWAGKLRQVRPVKIYVTSIS